jgi:hypothetical protein
LYTSPFSHRYLHGTNRFVLGKRSFGLPGLRMSDGSEVHSRGLSSASLEDIPTGPDAFYSPMEVIYANLVVRSRYSDLFKEPDISHIQIGCFRKVHTSTPQ